MILLVAQLILPNCPTFLLRFGAPLGWYPRHSRGCRGIITKLDYGVTHTHQTCDPLFWLEFVSFFYCMILGGGFRGIIFACSSNSLNQILTFQNLNFHWCYKSFACTTVKFSEKCSQFWGDFAPPETAPPVSAGLLGLIDMPLQKRACVLLLTCSCSF